VAWNIAWKDAEGMGDDEYLAAWQCILLPIAVGFQPQLVLISAGFDAARGDIGGCSITPEGFSQLTRMLQELCPQVVLVLEGGYNLGVISECFTACARTLLGEDVALRGEARPKGEARLSIERTLRAHRPFWDRLNGLGAGSASPIPLLGVYAPGGISEAIAGANFATQPVSKSKKKDDKLPSGLSIATRHAAEGNFKSDVKKLMRKEAELRAALDRIGDLKKATQNKLSRKDRSLVEDEEELKWQMKEVASELQELNSLSKGDMLRMYTGAR